MTILQLMLVLLLIELAGGVAALISLALIAKKAGRSIDNPIFTDFVWAGIIGIIVMVALSLITHINM